MPRVYIIRKGYYEFTHSQGNFSGGGSQNAIWSGSQSNVGPQDRIFAGNYASGMQDDCDPPQVMVNGVCVDEGLGGDPTRIRPKKLYSTQADDPNLRQVGGGCEPLCGTPPNCRPCSSTGPTFGAKQIGGACGQGLCGTPPNCRPCSSTGPTYPQKQVANPGCYPPCGKDEYCEGGQCYSGQPSARQKVISRRRR